MMLLRPCFRLRLAAGTALLAAGALAACSRSTAPAETAADATAPTANLRRVRLQTDWFPQPEHGGYYQALARGFYREEGLAVEILPGGPNAAVMSTVATGRAEFGMTNGDDVIVAIARGVPLRMFAAEMQRDAQGILFHGENPLSSLRDLDGKTVMAGPGSVWIQYVQRHYGIRFDLVPLAGDLARFMNDARFIQQCFVTNEPFFARQRGADARALLIASAEAGYEPYRVMFASRQFIDAHPEVVRAFARASVRGWIDYLEGDPTAGDEELRRLRPDLPPEFFAFSRAAMKEYQLVLGDPARGERAGQLTRPRLARQIEVLREVGVLERPLSVDAVATFDFLPDSALPPEL
jgi:NitT/TauT family transport system substrate-binding protein